MKRSFSFMVLCLFPVLMFSQIHITPFIPNRLYQEAPDASIILENKLNSILSANEIQSSLYGNSRFIITCNWTNVSKSVIGSAPTKIAYKLDLHLHIGDGLTGTKYGSQSINLKGVGNTEEKAYINAFKNLNVKSSQISDFIIRIRKRIIDYYNTNQNAIIASIKTSISIQNYQEAAYQLNLIPMECTYYDTAREMILNLHQLVIDRDAANLLSKAKATWAASQNESSAQTVVNILSNINPLSSSYQESQNLMNSITKKVEGIQYQRRLDYEQELSHNREMEKERLKNQRELDMAREKRVQKQLDNEHKLESQRINAIKEFAVEYAKNQPQHVSYNIHGWY